jgi:FERM central domain
MLYFFLSFFSSVLCSPRYQLYLQVKQDVLQGRLPVAFELAAELGAYVVQGKKKKYSVIFVVVFVNNFCITNCRPTPIFIHHFL